MIYKGFSLNNIYRAEILKLTLHLFKYKLAIYIEREILFI